MYHELPELIYVRTIPHTGTHFVLDLLLHHVSEKELCFTGVQQGLKPEHTKFKPSKHIRKLIEKQISYEKFIRNITKYYKQEKVKYLALYEHISFFGSHSYNSSDTWICDLVENGYQRKTIMTVRDYRKAIITVLLRTIENPVERKRHLRWLWRGYQFLSHYYKHPDYFVLPVDAIDLGFTVEQRFVLLKKVLTEFIQLNIDNNKLEFLAKSWTPQHTLLKDNVLKNRLENSDEYKLLMKMRCDPEMRYIPELHFEYDCEIEIYNQTDKLKELFSYFGYKNQ